MEEEKEKPINSNLTSRIWKLGTLTTEISANIVLNKIKDFVKKDNSSSIINNQVAEKIAKVLGELKGPLMKLGQYLSLHDVFNTEDDFFQKFNTLHYQAPSMSFYFTKMQIEKELGKSPDYLFKSFSRKPIGSASIGQVHEAFLKDGRKVAVKVQYPDMEKIIKSDLTTLKIGLTPLKYIYSTNLEPIINEIEGILTNELNYKNEADNIKKFSNFFKNYENIIIPDYIPELSTQKVLTMNFIEGRPFEVALKEDNLSQEECNNIGKLLLHSLWNQLFKNKTIHADPHPGNFLIVNRNKLCLLDFGCVKVFSNDFVETYKRLIRAILEKDISTEKQCYVLLGFANENEEEKLDAIHNFSEFTSLPYTGKDFFDLSKNLDKLKEGQKEFKKMADKVGFRLPKDFVYLNRTLFGLGMLLFKLKVNLNFYNEMEKYIFDN
ncbi:MAG: ABC transporter [Candidatus Sericytochromatia bacterium]|nr:MAG: ABC transporter [Candidatus Sericytochromatia bacterium]